MKNDTQSASTIQEVKRLTIYTYTLYRVKYFLVYQYSQYQYKCAFLNVIIKVLRLVGSVLGVWWPSVGLKRMPTCQNKQDFRLHFDKQIDKIMVVNVQFC